MKTRTLTLMTHPHMEKRKAKVKESLDLIQMPLIRTYPQSLHLISLKMEDLWEIFMQQGSVVLQFQLLFHHQSLIMHRALNLKPIW
jgi:hypothetical protein